MIPSGAKAIGKVAEKHGLLLTTVTSLDPPVQGSGSPFPLFLTPRQLNGAKEGDEVEVSYSSSKTIGEWTVTKILGKLF